MTTCPECRATVRTDANFCAACGTFLGWHEPLSSRVQHSVGGTSAPAPHAALHAPAAPALRGQREPGAHGVVLEVSEETLELQPGGTAQASVRICNTGQVVDEFDLWVCGSAAAWAEVDPPRVAVYPRAEETVTLRFRPPRDSTVPAGPVPVTVVAQSALHVHTSARVEAVVDVAAYDDLSAVLLPHAAEGRGLTRHRFIVTSRGNRDRTVELPPQERQGAVRVLAEPASVTVPPGADAVVGIEVRSGWRWWGEPRQHGFSVRGRALDGVALTGSGTSTQHPVLPSWALRLLLLALVVLAVLVVWLQVAGDVRAIARDVGDALSAFGRDLAQIWDNLKGLGDDQPPTVTPGSGPTDLTSPTDG